MSSVNGRLACIAREIEAMKNLQEPVLCLNYCKLEEIPEELLCNEYCKKKLQKLYIKQNCIETLVCLVILVLTSPIHFKFLLQNADIDRFQALTFLYLHSNYLTELPHGKPAQRMNE